MYSAGSYVIYGGQGVCLVEQVRREALAGTEREYYILRPQDDPKMVIYVPTDAENLVSQMRPLLTPEELSALIRRCGQGETLPWINDPRARSEQFRQILEEGDRARIFAMLVAIHARREALTQSGRKLYAADETACRRGERLLHGEIAAVLQIHPEEVRNYIRSQLASEG